MTKTVSDLATAVMRRLGAVDINKQPTAAQKDWVSTLYDELYVELQRDDKVYWLSADIPDLMIGALSRIIAERMAPTLGMPVPTEADERGEQVSIGTHGWRMLERWIAREASGLPTAANYF